MVSNPLVGIDPTIVANWARQLEARCDPVFIAQEIRLVLAAAKPAEDPAHSVALAAALKKHGAHTHGLHTAMRCRVCEALESFEKRNG